DLARLVLKGPLLSDSFLPDWPVLRWWRHSAAIRPDEAFDSLYRIATGRRPATDIERKRAQALLVALGMDEKTISDATSKLQSAQEPTKSVADTGSDAVRSVSN